MISYRSQSEDIELDIINAKIGDVENALENVLETEIRILISNDEEEIYNEYSNIVYMIRESQIYPKSTITELEPEEIDTAIEVSLIKIKLKRITDIDERFRKLESRNIEIQQNAVDKTNKISESISCIEDMVGEIMAMMVNSDIKKEEV